ncbi:MAG TPA: hypothetical protein VER98_12565 [Terriglobia bacterium]|nr:hypothetical protein [Terriglobia bacterium]
MKITAQWWSNDRGHVSSKRAFTNGIPKWMGPELTGRKFFYDYLVQLLANPSGVRDRAGMPNLNLGKDDISALVAFINRGDQRWRLLGN